MPELIEHFGAELPPERFAAQKQTDGASWKRSTECCRTSRLAPGASGSPGAARPRNRLLAGRMTALRCRARQTTHEAAELAAVAHSAGGDEFSLQVVRAPGAKQHCKPRCVASTPIDTPPRCAVNSLAENFL